MSFSLATYGPAGANYAPLAYHWTTVFPVHPALRRSCHAMIAYSRSGVSGTVDVFAILGGWSVSRGRCNDVWETLDRGQTWHCVSESAAWSPRSQFSALSSSDGSTIFVIGGDDGDYRSDVWVSKDYCRTFNQITRSAPFKGRAAFSACLLPISGHLLIGCGRTVGEPVAVLNDVWLSKDGGESWIQLWLHAPFPARSGSPLISGFVNSHQEKRCGDGRKKRRRRTSPTRRTCRVVLACGSAGGRSTLGDVWISDDEGRSWTEVSSTDDHHYHYKGEAFEHLEISRRQINLRPIESSPPEESSPSLAPLPDLASAENLQALELSSSSAESFAFTAKTRRRPSRDRSPANRESFLPQRSGCVGLFDEISGEFILISGFDESRPREDCWSSRNGLTWFKRPLLAIDSSKDAWHGESVYPRKPNRTVSLQTVGNFHSHDAFPSPFSINFASACANGCLLVSGGEDAWGSAVGDLFRSVACTALLQEDLQRTEGIVRASGLIPADIWRERLSPFLFRKVKGCEAQEAHH